MDISKVLASKTGQVIVLLIGLVVLVALLFDLLVSSALQPILIVAIILVTLYFLAHIIRIVNRQLLHRLSLEVARNLPPEPSPTIVHTVSPAGHGALPAAAVDSD